MCIRDRRRDYGAVLFLDEDELTRAQVGDILEVGRQVIEAGDFAGPGLGIETFAARLEYGIVAAGRERMEFGARRGRRR